MLEIGGCDALELAREFGTPAYVVAEDDLRARARAFAGALAARATTTSSVRVRLQGVPVHRRLPRVRRGGPGVRRRLGRRAAPGAAARLRRRERIVVHGNAKSEAELRDGARRRRRARSCIDNFDEIERLEGAACRARRHAAPCCCASRRTSRRHARTTISTGQADSKFGFALADAPEAIARVRGRSDGLDLRGLHAHIGSQLLELEPFRARRRRAGRAGRLPGARPRRRARRAYTADEPPAVDRGVRRATVAAPSHEPSAPRHALLIEPGRALCANAGVTLYTVESVKQNVSRWVGRRRRHVRQPAPDALRRALRGARRRPLRRRRRACALAGKHCESGDVIVREALLDDPRPGDVVVTPATGAYGHAMANNYNGVPRPPVIFCKDGDARVVVRRETYEDLACAPASAALTADVPRRPARARHGRRRRSPTLLDERADEIERFNGARPVISRRAHPLARRLRGDPRRRRTCSSS